MTLPGFKMWDLFGSWPPALETDIQFAPVGQTTSNGSSFSISTGGAHPNRYVVLTIAAVAASGFARQVTGVTIDGIAMTRLEGKVGISDQNYSGIWIANVPLLASSNVSVASTGFDKFTVQAYRGVRAVAPTLHDSALDDTTNPHQLVLDMPAGSFAFVVTGRFNSASTITMTSVVVDWLIKYWSNRINAGHGSLHSPAASTLTCDITIAVGGDFSSAGAVVV
jgi:hypothetical protein